MERICSSLSLLSYKGIKVVCPCDTPFSTWVDKHEWLAFIRFGQYLSISYLFVSFLSSCQLSTNRIMQDVSIILLHSWAFDWIDVNDISKTATYSQVKNGRRQEIYSDFATGAHEIHRCWKECSCGEQVKSSLFVDMDWCFRSSKWNWFQIISIKS